MRERRQAALGFIFVTMLVDVIGIAIIIPVVPGLIKELIGGSLSDASIYNGWLLFSFAFTQFIFAPILGNLSDQYGRRPVLLISLLGYGLDYIFLALSPTMTWLFVGRILSGVMGASFTTATAYIADISTPEKRAQNFGLVGAAFGIGFIIGPVIGGVLGNIGLRVPFYAAAAITLLNCLYGYFILPESLQPENRRKFEWRRANPFGTLVHLRKYPIISGLLVAFVLVYIASHSLQSVGTFFIMERFNWSEDMVGYCLGFAGILIVLSQGWLIRYINASLGVPRVVYLGLLIHPIVYLLFSFATQGWMMFAILVPYALVSIVGPAMQGLISNQVPANEQGELQGALTSLMSVTSIIGPPLMTALFSFYTAETTSVYYPGAPFALGALLTLISYFIARHSMKKNFMQKKTAEKESVAENN